MSVQTDAIVVGSGPNGLSAAIVLAKAGLSVLLVEGAPNLGGSVRSANLTLPGFLHDVCSAVYPMGIASPYWKQLPLHEHGLEWIQPHYPFAHPLDNGTAVIQERSIEGTAERLGEDSRSYLKLMQPLVRKSEILFKELLGPFRIPRHPLTAMKFGLPALRSGAGLARFYFKETPAQALWSGLAAHAVLPLEMRPGSAIALMLGIAGHAVGWPIVKGGSQNLTEALASYFRFLGGKIETDRYVKSYSEVRGYRLALFDVGPHQLEKILGEHCPPRYARTLKKYRYGPGVCKVDWALSAPIPWKAAECRVAGTIHVGGTLEEVCLSESEAWKGVHSERPFVMLGQPTINDPNRAPSGQHTAWGYCHVPNGSSVDMTERIESQVERFAPGFRETILARYTRISSSWDSYNPNLVGGDIVGGVADLYQLFARPALRWNPYSTPLPGVFICSASSPPGAGVHGLCGYYAAHSALKSL